MTSNGTVPTTRVYELDTEPYDFTPAQITRLIDADLIYREDGEWWQRPNATFVQCVEVAGIEI